MVCMLMSMVSRKIYPFDGLYEFRSLAHPVDLVDKILELSGELCFKMVFFQIHPAIRCAVLHPAE